MLHFVKRLKGSGTDAITMATNVFKARSFMLCLLVSVTLVSNDLKKYLPRNSVSKDCSKRPT